MSSDAPTILTSAAATLEFQVPTLLQRTDDFNSTHNQARVEPPSEGSSRWKGIDWTRLKGYQIPQDGFAYGSWIWEHGFRLWEASTNKYFWLCRRCHLRKRSLKKTLNKEPMYRSDLASSAAAHHLTTEHKINKHGEVKTKVQKRKVTMDNYIEEGATFETALENQAALDFDIFHFKALLFDWIIADGISFRKLESPKLRSMLSYLQGRCSNQIPCRPTVSRNIGSIYDKVLGLVTESLARAITRISFSFDLWTSKNQLALLGLCAHYIDFEGKPITTLLALPRQRGRHTGLNISETVNEIVAHFNLQDKLGFFTTDNASSNESCMKVIAASEVN